jgi:hypothetical protein
MEETVVTEEGEAMVNILTIFLKNYYKEEEEEMVVIQVVTMVQLEKAIF